MKLLLTILFSCFIGFSGFAQILDDSTKLVYGPTTTRHFSEEDVYYNRDSAYIVDTTINGFDYYDYTYQQGVRFQNLGGYGTALMPMYFQLPDAPGTWLGLDAYSPYYKGPDQLNYYDTRSPYTRLYYVQGSRGEQLFDMTFSRNVNPNWNVGFNARRTTSNKQYGIDEQPDPLMSQWYFAGHTSFQTKNKKYRLLANFIHFNHSVEETGGVVQDSSETRTDLFDYRLEDVELLSAFSWDRRNNYHLYHQFAPAKSFQLFHEFDRISQKMDYEDSDLTNSIGFYPDSAIIDASMTDDHVNWQLFENRAGIKGRVNALFYSGWIKRRDFIYSLENKWHNEHAMGGEAGFENDIIKAKAAVSVMFQGDYKALGSFKWKYIDFSYTQLQRKPTLFQQYFIGNHHFWNNNFTSVLYQSAYVGIPVKLKGFEVKPFAEWVAANDLIYVDSTSNVAQSSESNGYIKAGLDVKLKWHNIVFRDRFTYAQSTGAELLRVPELYNMMRVYYENSLFNNVLLLQFGFELNYRSAYFANAYMPDIQQFYLQDNFELRDYLLADVFLNANIKRARIFLKMAHINQGWFAKGYYATPYYPGDQRAFEFGVDWQFFD